MKNHITLKQKIVEILAYVLMWASIVIGIIWSAKLPKEVATHFDAAGNADGYGSPYSFLFLPIIMLIPTTGTMEYAGKGKTGTCGACVWGCYMDDRVDGVWVWCIHTVLHACKLYTEDAEHACRNFYFHGRCFWRFDMGNCRVCAA